MKEKPQDCVEPEEVDEEADAVLEEITTEDMTLKEKARAIYDWCRDNIGYVSTSDKDSWTNGAHQGFTEGEGDCFVFFATAKACLLYTSQMCHWLYPGEKRGMAAEYR